MLHSEVEKLFYVVFRTDDQQLIKHLFEDAKILNWIVEAAREEYIELHTKGGRLRKGYLGHLTRIANSIVELGAEKPNITSYLNGKYSSPSKCFMRNFSL